MRVCSTGFGELGLGGEAAQQRSRPPPLAELPYLIEDRQRRRYNNDFDSSRLARTLASESGEGDSDVRLQVFEQWRGPEAHSETGKEADIGRRCQGCVGREAFEPRGGIELIEHSVSPRNEYPP